MSEELKNIEEKVMMQIHQGKIKIKPRIYFVIGSILTFIGLVSSIITSVFMFGLLKFSLRIHYGRGAQYKLEQMLLEFPWWIIVLAILGLLLGIYFIRKYDFSYKKNPLVIIIGFILAILLAGWFIDAVGLNEILLHSGPMKGIMRNSF